MNQEIKSIVKLAQGVTDAVKSACSNKHIQFEKIYKNFENGIQEYNDENKENFSIEKSFEFSEKEPVDVSKQKYKEKSKTPINFSKSSSFNNLKIFRI